MAGASLTFDILARDRASSALSRVGRETETLHGRFTTLAKRAALVAGAAGLGAIAAAARTGLGEVSDYQRGFAQLEQGLKTTGGVAGISAKQMEDLASSIEGYSGQTDDSIVKTEQLLLTFTNIRNQAGKNNDVFTQTTKIAADMAARMGGDASGAAIQLGKALNDPVKGITALTRVGVSFTEHQKAQIAALVKSGDTMGAQKVILGELNKEFGGSAKAVGDTLPGQIEKAKRAWEGMSQQLVTALLPTFTSLVRVVTEQILPALQGMLGFVKENATWLKPLAIAVGSVVAVVYTVVKAIRAWTIVQAALDVVLNANPIGLIVIGLAALAAGLVVAWKKSETFRHIVHGAMHVVSVAIHGVVDAGQAVVSWFKHNWQYVVAGLIAGPFGLAVVAIHRHWDDIVNGVKGMGRRIKGAAVGMWDGIKESFRSAINWVIDKLNWVISHFHITLPKVNTHIPGVGTIGGESFGASDSAIPHLARGGIIPATPGGRLVLAGEAGAAERIQPLGPGGLTAGERRIIALLESMPGQLDRVLRGAALRAEARV